MVLKKIAHSLIRWTDDDGIRREAFSGDEVDLPQRVVDKYDKHGAFLSDDVDADVEALDVPAPLIDAIVERLELDADADEDTILAALDAALAANSSAVVEPEPVSDTQPVATTVEPAPAPKSDDVKPKPTDLVKVWEDYAVSKGFDRKEAEAMSKTDLIKALS